MNRRQLIVELATAFHTSQANAWDMLDTFVSVIEKWLLEWQEVNLYWFGSFSVATRASKKWINPRTMESITVPWYSTPRFKASKNLKTKIRNKFN